VADIDMAKQVHEYMDTPPMVHKNNRWSDDEEVVLPDRFGDLVSPAGDEPPHMLWYPVPHTRGGDYAGSLVEVSNHQFLQKWVSDAQQEIFDADFEDDLSESIRFVSGGAGSFGVWVRGDFADPDFKELMESLDDFPLIDADLWHQLTDDAAHEAWETCARDEYVQELESLYDLEAFEVLDEDAFFRFFDNWADGANEYWSNEQGTDMHIDVRSIAVMPTHELQQAVREGLDELRRHGKITFVDSKKEKVASKYSPKYDFSIDDW
jgi:hypothetical protein